MELREETLKIEELRDKMTNCFPELALKQVELV